MPSVDLDNLQQQLSIAAKLYESPNLEFQRKAVTAALSSVADHLEARGLPPETLAPILRPVLALAERENNNLDQMFAERAREGRPNATIDDLERTGILAALSNFWLKIHQNDGRNQNAKLAEAARKMRGHWFGKVTRANLKTARDTVSQEAKDHPSVVIANLFDEMLNDTLAFVGEDGTPIGQERVFQLMIDYVNQHPASRMKGIWKTLRVSPNEDS